MESSFFNSFILITILLVVIIIIVSCLVLSKHFSKKNLQEKQISIIFASEIERDRVLALIERDRKETEDLEKMTKDFGLK